MSKTMLRDTMYFTPIIPISESINNANGGKMIVKGVVQRADAKNQNGRIYPKAILKREVDRYINEFVRNRRALGELDHSDDMVVSLGNVSHNILALEWQGNDVVGTIEILDTPAGKILKELFKAGIQVGISSRAMGSIVQREGADVVEDDLQLMCWDYVSNPSTEGAFPRPIREGKEITRNNPTPSDKWARANHIVSEIFSVLK